MLFKTATSRNIYSIVGCGIVATIATAGILFSVSYNQIRQTSMQSMDELVKAESLKISETFHVGSSVVSNLGTTLNAMKATGTADRAKADALLKGLLENNSFALGVWTGWDANAFDGKDADYVGKPAHDATGRYVPYWVRSEGKIIQEVLVDYDKPGAGDYYLLAHDKQKPVVIEPYIYPVGGKDVLMTSLVSPIMIDGKSVGVAGMDMALSDLNARLSALKPFETGSVILLSQSGVIVSYPDAKLIGKSLKDSGLDANSWQTVLSTNDTAFDITGPDGQASIAISVPVNLLPDTTWQAVVIVPKATLFASLNQTMMISAAIVVGAALLLALAGYVLSSGFQRRILRIVSETAEIAGGNTTKALTDAGKKDELGDLARSLTILRDANADTLRLHAEATQASQQRALDRQEQEKLRLAQEAQIQFVITELGNGLTKLADGDVTVNLATPFAGAMDQLRTDFNQSVSKLQSTLQSFSHSASAIHAGSEEIRHAADDLSRRTEQQAASVEETAAALEQITTSVKDSTKRAEDVGALVAHTRQGAEHSGHVVTSAVEAMSAIEKSSQEISNIIGVIDEIAFQTNLLALNAGVEAARAGEAGKGFAVVAQEVRELAQRSANAAKEIKKLIMSSGEQVKRGVDLVGETGSALQVISAEVQEINGHIQAIVRAAREQSNGLAEINNAVNLIDQGTQKNAAMVEESNAASHTLASEANNLNQLLGTFRLGNERASASRPVARGPQPVTPAHSHQPAKSPVAPMLSKLGKAFGGKSQSAAAAAVPVTQEWEDF